MELQAKDLRIGNYVNYKFWNPDPKNPDWAFSRVEIVGVLKDTFYFKTENDNRTVKIGELHPIPLTEEILLRLEIIKKNFTEDMPEELQKPDIDEDGNIWYTWVKGAFNLEIQTSGEIWFEVYSHYIHVKYVHQLQNLYFALTGEELEFKQEVSMLPISISGIEKDVVENQAKAIEELNNLLILPKEAFKQANCPYCKGTKFVTMMNHGTMVCSNCQK